MLTHILGDSAHSDAREVIDAEARIAWVILRKQTLEAWLQQIIFETLLQLSHAHCFRQLLKQYFDEDTTRGCRLFFVKVNAR